MARFAKHPEEISLPSKGALPHCRGAVLLYAVAKFPLARGPKQLIGDEKLFGLFK